MKTNTEWLAEAIEFVSGQKRKMQVVVCFDAGDGRNEFGAVQSQDGDDVTVTVKGSLPSTLGSVTTKRISTDSIQDVITELV